MPLNAIVIESQDNIATAVRRLQKGENVSLFFADHVIELVLSEDIPFGHKFALVDIETGDPIIKYGEKIGLASRKIARGEHVHIHNVEGDKGRGDKQ